MKEQKNSILYTNQLLKLLNISEEKNEYYVSAFCQDNIIRKLKIVKSEKNKLVAATKKEIDSELIAMAESKFNNSKIQLTDKELDSIEDYFDQEAKKHGKIERSERRKKEDIYKKELIELKRDKLKKSYISSFFMNSVHQFNGVFFNEDKKTGIIQIVGDPQYKAKNCHTVKDDGIIVELSVKRYTKKDEPTKFLMYSDLKDNTINDYYIQHKLSVFSPYSSVKDLFKINNYLINKISEKGLYLKKDKHGNGYKYDYELNNLLKISITEKNLKKIELLKEKEEFTKIINSIEVVNSIVDKYKNSINNLSDFIYGEQEDSDLIILTMDHTDIELLKENYLLLLMSITETIDNKKYLNNNIFSFINIFVNVYVHYEKRTEYLNTIYKNLIDDVNSSLIPLERRTKKDIRSNLENCSISGVLEKIRFSKMKNDKGKYVLNDNIYAYPPLTDKKTTQRVMAYNSKETGFIPNVMPVSEGKARGYNLNLTILNFLLK